ncbi:hypothetical protein ACIOMP_06890 [Pseudomonas protegens]|uniref:hypothetical protein n=1 Tax=Pseudomonas protegens TaxID=380021 RepID=UPI0038259DEA
MGHSSQFHLALFCEAIESKANEILQQALIIKRHGNPALAEKIMAQARLLLDAVEELKS